MKHHSNHVTFLATLLLCINLETDNRSTRIAWLSRNAIQINSIDPTIANDDFADLTPLKAAIGNARIVVLGEQSHGDGATFLAKGRLVKFLHQLDIFRKRKPMDELTKYIVTYFPNLITVKEKAAWNSLHD